MMRAWLVCRKGVMTGILGIAGAMSAGRAQSVADSRPRPGEAFADVALTRPVTVHLDRVPLETAIRAIAKNAGVRLQFQADVLEATPNSVTLHANKLPLGVALDRVMAGTSLHVVAIAPDLIGITSSPLIARRTQGAIRGTVTDAQSKRPLRGAKVGLDGVDQVAQTSDEGTYQLANVSTGSHTVSIKLIGYTKVVRTVTVQEAIATTVDVALQPSATALDQVVVTGTIIQTELKAVPNAITVITAKQIEERGITKIDQLFRGDVPGLFAPNQGSGALLNEVSMFSRGATALSTLSAGADSILGNTNVIKTYIDGIELADPKYLSQIDPQSIDRIEILTGPQASTIYGSNAINGVMQIFTKRGSTSHPQLTLNLLSGWVENNFSSARTPQHDYSTQLNGIEGRLSYNAGGSWNYMGPWTPAQQLTRTNGFGGIRLDLSTPAGRVGVDMTLRRSLTQSLLHGSTDQGWTRYRVTGWYIFQGSPGVSAPMTRSLQGQTIGLTLSYVPTGWWSHELGIGQDLSNTEIRITARGYGSRADSVLQLQQTQTSRQSLRYATTVRIPVSSVAQVTVAAGADEWQNLTSGLLVTTGQSLTGVLTGTTNVSRVPGHNVGGFLQSQLGFKDQLFFTYGLRMERNPTIGDKARVLPGRYGVSYTQEFGNISAKIRGSYGRSIRPPLPTLKARVTVADGYGSDWLTGNSDYILPFYGENFDWQLPNPELSPEYQQGGEGGLELYVGNRGSLIITRYNQTVDGLIERPIADSVRTRVVCPIDLCFADSYDSDGYGYWRQYQYLNIGSIRNQGWELQSSVNLGPLTTHGTYSWTKSRMIGITPQYRSYFSGNPQYQPGATFQYLPEHTWAAGVTYAKALSSIAINVTGTGKMINSVNDFLLHNLDGKIRLMQNRYIFDQSRYVISNNGYVLADLTASHRFVGHVDGVLQIHNLADKYMNDYAAYNAVMGRQTQLGARIRL